MENQSLIGDYRIHYKEVTDVAISDGIVAVSSSDFSTENFSLISKGKGALDVFTFSGQRIISRLFDYSGISLMEFSPYNPNLLVFRESEKINVLDISEDMLLHTFISGGFVTDYVIMDGYLLSSSADGTIRLWVMDGIGWEYAFSRITLPQSINNIAVHAGVMAVSYNSSNKAIILRDLKNEDALVLSDHYGSIGGCSFNPDGSRLLTYTADSGQIAVWDWETKDLAGMIETGHNLLFAQYIDGGGKIFAPAKDGTMLVYDGLTLEPVTQTHVDTSLHSKFISSDGSLYAAITWGGVKIIRTADLSTVVEIKEMIPKAILFCAQNSKVVIQNSLEVKIYSCETGEELFAFREEESMKSIAVDDNKQLLAMICPDNSVRLVDLGSYEERYSLDDFEIAALRVLFDAEGEYLFVCMDDCSLRCYEAESGKPVAELKGMSAPVVKVTFDADKTCLITQGDGSEAIIWRWESRKKLGRIAPLLGISSDFRTLVSFKLKDLILIPLYDTRMLVQQAEKQLAGRTLSDKDREDLFILK